MPTSRPHPPPPHARRPPPRGPSARRAPPRPKPRRRPSLRVRRRRALAGLASVAVAVTIVVTSGRHRPGPATAQPAAAHPTTAGPASGQLGGRLFTPGACVALPPTSGDHHQTVFLDAGHGGPDPGASGTTTDGQAVDERQLTLPVVTDAATMLRADGYRVVMSRTADISVARLSAADVTSSGQLSLQGEHADIEARVGCANLSGAAVLLSVHFNAFSDPSARGLLSTYDDSRPFTASNLQFAQLVDTNVLAALHAAGWPVPDRGVVADTAGGAPPLSEEAHQYGHLLLLGPSAPGWLDHPTTMPGALVEPLFLTAPSEASVAAGPAGQRAIAAGIAAAAEAFLNRPSAAPPAG